jgi:competence protein ComEC
MKKNPHDRLFSHYPLLQLALAFAAGILFAHNFNFKTNFYLQSTAVCSVVAIVSFALRRGTISGHSLLLAFAFAGGCLLELETTAPPQGGVKQLLERKVISEEQSVILTGTLNGPVEYARDRLYMVVNVEEIFAANYQGRVSGVVSLMATFKTAADVDRYRQLNLGYRSRVQVFTNLNRSDKHRNPGVSTITEYLDRKNHDATGVVKSPSEITKLSDSSGFSPLSWLYSWRSSIQLQIDQNFSPETAGVLDAALLGNRYNLSKNTTELFREAGTFHVLVISGLHISFIGGLIYILTRRLTRKRWIQFAASNLVVWSYSLAVGAEASVVRATLMFTVLTFGMMLFRRPTALNSLGCAALVLLIRSPKDLLDPSLQLTFLSVLAIVTIGWPLLQNFKMIGSWHPTRETPYPPDCHPSLKALCECLYWSERYWRSELERMPHEYRLFKSTWVSSLERFHLQRPLRYIFSSIVVSISVQVVLLPFLIVYFHRISLASLVLNVVVSFLLATLSAVALVAIALNHVSLSLSQPLFRLANGIDWLTTHSVDPFSYFATASFRIGEYSGRGVWVYIVYFIPLVLLMMALQKWRPLGQPTGKRNNQRPFILVVALVQLVLLGAVIVHPLSAGPPDGKLHVDFLDVGQGDSALITLPDGSTLLVDGGGRPTFSSKNAELFEREASSIGERVVSEYLWWRGLESVDYVLATHADADHIDGLNDVARNFNVRAALVGRQPNDDPEFAKFAQTALALKIPVEVVAAGDELRLGDVVIEVLWPRSTSDPEASSLNNDSVVLLLKFGERKILLTGDIEKEAERQVLATNDDVDVDVVKVAHHGSRTSSTEDFVQATSPRYAIVSVGRTSMFGHPHAEVVERWKQNGAEVLTTGECGTISLTTDGKELWLSNFVNEKP